MTHHAFMPQQHRKKNYLHSLLHNWHSEKAFCFNNANEAKSKKYTTVHKPDVLGHWFANIHISKHSIMLQVYSTE